MRVHLVLRRMKRIDHDNIWKKHKRLYSNSFPTTSTSSSSSSSSLPGDNGPEGRPVITFVTGNPQKLQEVKRLLANNNTDTTAGRFWRIQHQHLDLPELQGDPVDIATHKCTVAAATVNGPVITEDTSLGFVALNGLPGPYIKWFLQDCGHEGLNRMLDGFANRTAYAQTLVGYCAGPGLPAVVFQGQTKGEIVRPRGSLDFGWDPIFEPCKEEGKNNNGGGDASLSSSWFGKTYAEMTKEEKDSISHRGKAFAKLRDYLQQE